MLSNTTMGVFALAVLWVNTLLVVGAALQRLRELAARRARFVSAEPREGSVGLLRGKLVGTESSDAGVVARTTIEQLGRYGAGASRTILWHDRSYGSSVAGGGIDVSGTVVTIAPDAGAEVWPTEEAVERAAVCTSLATFDAAFEKARKAKGFARTIDVPIREGQDVWVFGEVVETSEGLSVRKPSDAPLLVSSIDPRAWTGRKMAFLAAFFVPAVLLGAGISTALALSAPHFGTVSMIGAGLGFLYFLLVLPAGTAARDAVRAPHERIVRGKWVDPAGNRSQSGVETPETV